MRNLIAQAADTTFKLQPNKAITQNVEQFSLPQILAALITFALVVAAVIFFLMLVIGGIRWIMSGGDKGQTEAARGQITAALIGLVIVFAAWAIASLVGRFFGVDIFNLTLPSVTTFTK